VSTTNIGVEGSWQQLRADLVDPRRPAWIPIDPMVTRAIVSQFASPREKVAPAVHRA